MPRRFLRVPKPEEIPAWTLSRRAFQDFRDLGMAAGGSGEATPQEGMARKIRPAGNRFGMTVESPTGGVVVSSVSYAPGWRVEIDGRDSAAFEVNGGFLGFEVPSGVHAVRLVYRPRGWTVGLALFGLGAIAVIAAGLRAFHSSRSRW